MDPPQHWLHHKVFLIVFFFLITNLIALDIWVGMSLLGLTNRQPSQAKVAPPPSSQTNSQSCPEDCLTTIDKELSKLKLVTPSAISPTLRSGSEQAIRPASTQSTQPTTLPAPKVVAPSQDINTVKEFFIPLGTGTSTAEDWTDVPGVKAEVDNTKYGKIQKILFEASVHVPNANEIVEVRLYNESDKYVVPNSEFLYPSGTTQNFRIAEIQLGQGAKIYKVQMKTQLKFPANLDQARIHITTF